MRCNQERRMRVGLTLRDRRPEDLRNHQRIALPTAENHNGRQHAESRNDDAQYYFEIPVGSLKLK